MPLIVIRKTIYLLFIFLCLQAGAIVPVQQITTHPNIEMSASVSPDGQWLVFASDREGNFDIWIKNLSNNRIKKITSTKADEMYPCWAPDGKSIYFTSQHGDSDGDIFRAYLKEYSGILVAKDIKRLTYKRGFDSYPTVAPDGKTAAWVSERGGLHNLYLVDDFRKNFRQLTFAGATQPRWHPTRDILLFTSFRDGYDQRGDIWMLNLEAAPNMRENPASIDSLQRPLVQITSGPAADAFPAWSADGQSITFVRYDVDSDADGQITPGDKGRIWQADLIWENDAPIANNAFLDQSFHSDIVSRAWPLTSYIQDAKQPQQAPNGDIVYHSKYRNNINIWSLQTDTSLQHNREFITLIDSLYPLPRTLNSQDVNGLLFQTNITSLTNKELLQIGMRESAFYAALNQRQLSDTDKQQSLYELGVCAYLQGYKIRARDELHQITQIDSALFVPAELLLIGIERIRDKQTNWKNVLLAIERVAQNSTAEQKAIAELFYADVCVYRNDMPAAIAIYQQLIENEQTAPHLKLQSRYKLGQAYLKSNLTDKAIAQFLPILQNALYPNQLEQDARQAFFSALQTDNSNPIQHYALLANHYQNIPFIHDEALFRLAQAQRKAKKYDQALATCKQLLEQSQNHKALFKTEMQIADIYLKMDQDVRAIEHLENCKQRFSHINPAFAEQVKQKLLATLISTAETLKSFQEYATATSRYDYARELDASLIAAHAGYIESSYNLGKIDNIIDEYTEIVNKSPQDNIAMFALGLAYSYRGTQKFDLYNNPSGLKKDDLEKSVDILNQALALDYNNLDAFLALSYNYEMLENYTNWKENRKKNFVQTSSSLFKAPFVWMYRTLTFYNETKPPQYYESAIQQLTAALLLNDEKDNPQLEADLMLNLANNYYNLGEFGAARASQYYQRYLAYDSTFTDKRVEAGLKERMGHCALFLDDLQNGPTYLKRAIQLWDELDDDLYKLLNIKRLAMLYQIGEDYEKALEYFEMAAQQETRSRRYDGLLKSMRSIAYQHLMLEHYDMAIQYAEQALQLINDGRVKRSEAPPLYLKLAVSGIYLPVPYDLRRLGLKSTIHLTTEQEEAYIYTILALAFTYTKQYDKAINFYEEKLTMYRRQHDHDAQGVFYNNEGLIHFIRGDYNQAWKYFISAYWECYKNGYIGGHLLTLENAFHVATIIATDEPNPDYDLDLYYRSITHKCEYIFELTEKDADLYPQMYARLHMIMAEMIMLDRSSREHKTPIDRMSGVVQQLDRLPDAMQHLQTALMLAQQNRLPRETCLALFRIAKLERFANELEKSRQTFQQARTIAVRRQYHDLLWEIDTRLADILVESPKQGILSTNTLAPLYYYNEAIHTLKTYRISEPGRLVEKLAAKYNRPFWGAIQQHLAANKIQTALNMAENLKMYNFITTIEQENLLLSDPEKQSLYTTAKNLRDEINTKASSIFQLENSPSASVLQLQRQQSQLDSLENIEKALLSEIRTFAPEIERLVKEKSIDIKALQAGLSNDTGVLYHIADETLSHFWFITRDSLTYQAHSVSKAEMQKALVNFCDSQQQNTDSMMYADSLLKHVISYGQNVDKLYLIPDAAFLTFPWTTIAYSMNESVNILGIHSSLYDLQISIQNSGERGKNLFWADYRETVKPNDYYTILTQPNETKGIPTPILNENTAKSDMLHIHLNAVWNQTEPLRSTFKFRHNKTKFTTFMPLDLYELQSNAQFFLFDFQKPIYNHANNGSFQVLMQSVINTGGATVIANLWPLSETEAALFYSTFYKHFAYTYAAHALELTREELRANKVPAKVWGGFQLYGFGGERIAQKSFQHNYENVMHAANSAMQEKQWQQALLNFERAQALAPSAAEKEQIRATIKICAINMQNWAKVIELEQTKLSQARKSGNKNSIASINRELAFYHSRAGNIQQAQKHQNTVLRLQKQLGIKSNQGELLLETAHILQLGQNYDLAIQELQKAKQIFKAANDIDKQAECALQIAHIYTERQEQWLAAQKELQSINRSQCTPETSLAIEIELLEINIHFEFYAQADSIVNTITQNKTRDNSPLWTEFAIQKIELAIKRGQAGLVQNFTISTTDIQFRFRIALLHSTVALHCNEPDKANDYAHQALELVRQLNNHRSLAEAFKQLGFVAWALHDYVTAQNYFNKALISIKDSQNPRDIYELNMLSGFIALDLDDDITAAQHGQKALQTATEINSLQRKIKSWIILSRSVERSQRFHFAEMVKDSAAAHFSPNLEARGFLQMARLAVRASETDSAAAFYQAAISAIEKVDKSPTHLLFQGFSLDKQHFYEEYIDFLVNNKMHKQAWTIAQHAKNTTFNRAYLASAARLSAEKQQWIDRYDSLSYNYHRAIAAWNESATDSALLVSAQEQKQRKDNFQQQFQLEQEHVYSLRFPSGIDLQQFQSQLPEKAVLLDYFYTDKQIIIWAIDNKSIKLLRTELSKDEFESQLLAFGEAFHTTGELQPYSRDLYDLLIDPVQSEIKNKFVYLHPDKLLHGLAFAALQNRQNNFFAFQTTFAYWPGFPIMERQQHDQSLLIIHKDDAQPLEPLTKNISDHLQWYYDFALSINAQDILFEYIDASLAPFHYIHFGPNLNLAPHAYWQSGFAIGDKQLTVSQLSRLNLGKISTFQLENQGNNMDRKNGIHSFEKGLAFSGLEFVYDQNTKDSMINAVLFKRFYRYLADGMTPAEALQQAQLYIYDHIESHPSFWAGFKLCSFYK